MMDELIEKLELLKAEIEWDYSLEYQVVLDKVIRILRMLNGIIEELKNG